MKQAGPWYSSTTVGVSTREHGVHALATVYDGHAQANRRSCEYSGHFVAYFANPIALERFLSTSSEYYNSTGTRVHVYVGASIRALKYRTRTQLRIVHGVRTQQAIMRIMGLLVSCVDLRRRTYTIARAPQLL